MFRAASCHFIQGQRRAHQEYVAVYTEIGNEHGSARVENFERSKLRSDLRRQGRPDPVGSFSVWTKLQRVANLEPEHLLRRFRGAAMRPPFSR